MSSSQNDISVKLSLIAKLLYIQTKHQIKLIEKEIIKTDKQKKLYLSLDGKHNMEELQKLTGVSVKTIEPLLPEWERQGLIISFGKGNSKRYVNLANMVI